MLNSLIFNKSCTNRFETCSLCPTNKKAFDKFMFIKGFFTLKVRKIRFQISKLGSLSPYGDSRSPEL